MRPQERDDRIENDNALELARPDVAQADVAHANVARGLNRRKFLAGASAGAMAMTVPTAIGMGSGQEARADEPRTDDAKNVADANAASYKIKNDRIHQSIVAWCFKPMSTETLCRHAAAMGYRAVEIVPPGDWKILKKYGLVCSLTGSHGFAKGFANKKHHAECIDSLTKAIDATSDAGFPNVITFSGFAEGTSKDEGMKNCVEGLKKIVGHAEKKNVTLCFEMLNTRVDVEMKGHPGYLADDVEWVVELCKKIGSPRLKLLFDIYHVQIMQGDVISRIKQHREYIAHYHTAGVPGRIELDDRQENNYPAIMKAIVETGYKGYVAQEFIPTWKDPVAALAHAARVCDV